MQEQKMKPFNSTNDQLEIGTMSPSKRQYSRLQQNNQLTCRIRSLHEIFDRAESQNGDKGDPTTNISSYQPHISGFRRAQLTTMLQRTSYRPQPSVSIAS